MAFLRAQGWDIDVYAHIRRGGHVLGICGGYQMLGRVISDPEGLEGPAGDVEGLGLLDIKTVMQKEKTLREVEATHLETQLVVKGYEIHLGQTTGPDCARPFARIDNQPDGAISADGRVQGSYLHGMFSADAFRAAYLAKFDIKVNSFSYEAHIDETLDGLARHIETYLDLDAIFALAR